MQIYITELQDINGRLDCGYYQPSFMDLERKIRTKTSKKLGDYVLNIASGATPNKKNAKKYYAKSGEGGVPFLRVQNVTREGLNLENCIFINQKTHNGLLARSQIKEDYLITKITGVGRMAVSSVAPKGFEGNINQHLVAIRTKDRDVSESIATFLNTDIGEKLASHRSSGGTRPALDYQALLSIPVVINSNIVQIMKSAYKKNKQLLLEANKLSNSIKPLIFKNLGIDYLENDCKNIFIIESDKIKSGRIDPGFFLNSLDTQSSSKYSEKELSEVAELSKGKSISKKRIRPGNYPVVAGGKTSPYTIDKFNFDGDTVTVSASGAYSGFVWYHKDPIFASDCIVLKTKDEKICLTFYLYCVLKSKQEFIYNMQQGAGQPHVYIHDLLNLKIPIPPLSTQIKLINEVKIRMDRIKALQKEAENVIQKANIEVEGIILE